MCFITGASLNTQVAHQDVEISDAEFQIAHGKSKFLDSDKLGKMVREHAGSGEVGRNRFCFGGNLVQCFACMCV